MRATLLPPAPPSVNAALAVVTAAVALAAAVLTALAAPSTALAGRWLRPVAGEVARSFSYVREAPFAAGVHRGAILVAAAGDAVRAACSGRVVHAGPVAGQGGVVSVRCGTRRVSYLPLVSIAVREGAPLRAGAAIGTVAAGRGGLHLGVRREGDRFGYEDPLPLLARPDRPPPLLPHGSRPRIRTPRLARPRPPALRLAAARRRGLTAHPAAAPSSPAPAAARSSPDPTAAPLPVWAGLALLLCGTAGSGAVVERRRRRLGHRQLGPIVQVEQR